MHELKVGDFIQDKGGHRIKVAEIIVVDEWQDECKIRIIKVKDGKGYHTGNTTEFSIGYINRCYKKLLCSKAKLLAMAL